MANTYTWKTTRLLSYPTYQNQSNVVFTVQYQVIGTNGTNTVNMPRSQVVSYNSGETFIPYSELTDEICMSWVQYALGSVGVSSIESQIDNMLVQASLPPIQDIPLPWNTTSTTTSGASGT